MYTEEDLRASFGALEHEAPDAIDIMAGMESRQRRRTSRRRTAGVLTAAATVVVALAGVTFVLPTRSDTPETSVVVAAQGSELWRFPFAVDDIPGHRVTYRSRGATSQTAWVTAGDDREHPLTIRVFPAGGYDPTAARTGEPVQVNGKSGFYSVDLPCHCSMGTPATGLAWEYAPNAWALVQNEAGSDDRDVMLRVASAVRFDRTTPLRVPFRVGHIPSGLRPGNSGSLGSGSMNTLTTGAIGANVVLEPTNPQDRGLSISMNGTRPDLPVGEPVATNDPPFGPTVVVNLGTFAVQLSSHGPQGPTLPLDELTTIARSITPAADLDDPSTWFDAEQAIPAG